MTHRIKPLFTVARGRTGRILITLLTVASFFAIARRLPAQGETVSQNRTKGLIAPPRVKPFSLNPGDIVDILVFNTPELSSKYQLNPDGAIRLPGTGAIVIAGLTTTEAASALESRLKEAKVMEDAQVSVFLDKAAPIEVSVTGEVLHPGSYTLGSLPTLQGAIAAAGGVTPREGSTITITHRADPQHPDTIRVDSSSTTGNDPFLMLRPWDIVTVSQAGLIYVVGDVGHPGEYYLNNGRSLRALEALALAQGLKEYAAPEKATIIHTTATGVESIHINLSRIQKNLDTDPVLEPYDVLVIPHSGLKQFTATLLPGLSTTAANAVAIALVAR